MTKKGNYNYRNPVRDLSPQDIQKQLDVSSKLSDVLRALGVEGNGRNREVILSLIEEYKLSMDTFKENVQKRRDNQYVSKRLSPGSKKRRQNLPLSEYLVEGDRILPGSVKKRIFKEGILEAKCSCCGQLPEWNGKPLQLQVDHVNGNPKDNKIENLRVLCPNCHSQTDTWSGRNITKK